MVKVKERSFVGKRGQGPKRLGDTTPDSNRLLLSKLPIPPNNLLP